MLHRKWLPAVSGTLALSLLLLGGIPVSAKKTPERDTDGLKIEVKQGLALRSAKGSVKMSENDRSSKLVIITFAGPVEEAWVKKVEGMGVKLGDYVPDFTFIAKLSKSKDRDDLEELSFIKRVQPFLPAYKLSPALDKALKSNKDVDIAVVGFDQKEDVIRTLRKDERSVSQFAQVDGLRHVASGAVRGKSIEKLLYSDDVVAILPEYKNQWFNDVAARVIESDELEQTGYTGEKQIIGVGDSGLDTGDLKMIHPDLSGNIKKLYAVARKNDASDWIGHGTHVAGSIVGTGRASDGEVKGLAPDAKLVFHAIQAANGGFLVDINKMWGQSYKDGARIHSDSWGSFSDGYYTQASLAADTFLWKNKDMVSLIAAGNDGIDMETGETMYYSIASPANAKNVIAVGASENYRPEFGEEADEIDDVAEFSSRGPTADGRIKPDIVAPGTFVLSTKSRMAPDYDQYGDPNFWELYNDYYAYMGGTSMATPILAGGVAQVRQFLNEEGYARPSGALIKSMLLTGAEIIPESGMFSQGFGRADLKDTIDTEFYDDTKGLKTKETVSFTIDVEDTSEPLVATLVWTDHPPYANASRLLVNDLNLFVTTPNGEILAGNDFNQEGFIDNVNNVEQIWLPYPEEGKYTVTINGYNIPKGPQPYALSTNGELSKPLVLKEQINKGKVGTENGYKPVADTTLSLKKTGHVYLRLDWIENNAELELLLLDSKGKELARSSSENKPLYLDYDAVKTGSYKVRVQIKAGTKANYTLSMKYPN